jgi:hypothetical protein
VILGMTIDVQNPLVLAGRQFEIRQGQRKRDIERPR